MRYRNGSLVSGYSLGHAKFSVSEESPHLGVPRIQHLLGSQAPSSAVQLLLPLPQPMWELL